MKKKIIFIILFINGIFLFAQNFKLQNFILLDGKSFSFFEIKFLSDSKLEYEYISESYPIRGKIFSVQYEQKTSIKTHDYIIKKDNDIPYILLSNSIGIEELIHPDSWGMRERLKKDGELTDEVRKKIFFITCKKNKKLVDGEYEYLSCGGFKGFTLFDSFERNYDKPEWILYKNASSCLKENETIYDENNLYTYNWGCPWVEGVTGDGIGEYVEIQDTAPYERKFDFLLIMNGYFSMDKPYLYKQNSRVKQIKVTGLNSGKEKILDVLDTPHPQTVDISFLETQEPFRVTIMDVCKGTKYDDTCINCMEPYPYKVIPYEDSIGE